MLRSGKDSVMIWQVQPNLRIPDEEKEAGHGAWSGIPAKHALDVARIRLFGTIPQNPALLQPSEMPVPAAFSSR